jgi:hypothetical protein
VYVHPGYLYHQPSNIIVRTCRPQIDQVLRDQRGSGCRGSEGIRCLHRRRENHAAGLLQHPAPTRIAPTAIKRKGRIFLGPNLLTRRFEGSPKSANVMTEIVSRFSPARFATHRAGTTRYSIGYWSVLQASDFEYQIYRGLTGVLLSAKKPSVANICSINIGQHVDKDELGNHPPVDAPLSRQVLMMTLQKLTVSFLSLSPEYSSAKARYSEYSGSSYSPTSPLRSVAARPFSLVSKLLESMM